MTLLIGQAFEKLFGPDVSHPVHGVRRVRRG